MTVTKLDSRIVYTKARIREVTGGRAESLSAALIVAFEEINALRKKNGELEERIDKMGIQTLTMIPEGEEIDPHWRGKIEP